MVVKLYMLGTGSPRPDMERFSASQVIIIDDIPVLIDCGENVTHQLMLAGIGPETVKHLFFTHLHSDHVSGYIRFLLGGWSLGRRQLTVWGPPGTRDFHQRVIDLFKDDIAYRLSVGIPSEGIMDVNVVEIDKPGPIPCDLPAKVSAEEMVHNFPTYAYRFDINAKAVVFSGDTAPTDKLVSLARGADVLVHDAGLALNARYKESTDARVKKIWANLQKEHCTPFQAAQTAQRAGVKTLVLTHFLPGIDEKQVLEEAAQAFNGTVLIGRDLQLIEVT